MRPLGYRHVKLLDAAFFLPLSIGAIPVRDLEPLVASVEAETAPLVQLLLGRFDFDDFLPNSFIFLTLSASRPAIHHH